MNSGATFSTISSGAIVRMQKKTQFLFTEEETFWLPMTRSKRLLGLSVRLFPVHARPTARAERTRQMLQIFQKLQCLTDPSILTLICKRFIYVLTRNWSNDNPFLVYDDWSALSIVNISSERFPCLRAWPQRARRWVHPKESWKLQRFEMGIQNKYLIFLRIIFSLKFLIY